MRPALDDGDQEFLQVLQARGSATVQELCDIAGVTATAIRQRLNRLQSSNLITRRTERAGRGRPFHRYGLTDTGRQALGDNYGELAVLLWQEVQQIEDAATRDQLMERLRLQFVRRMGGVATGESQELRLAQLQDALQARGFHVAISCTADGLTVLQEHLCPYHELSQHDQSICEFERQVFERIVGAPLDLVQECHGAADRDGGHCCEFRLRPAGTAKTEAVESC